MADKLLIQLDRTSNAIKDAAQLLVSTRQEIVQLRMMINTQRVANQRLRAELAELKKGKRHET